MLEHGVIRLIEISIMISPLILILLALRRKVFRKAGENGPAAAVGSAASSTGNSHSADVDVQPISETDDYPLLADLIRGNSGTN